MVLPEIPTAPAEAQGEWRFESADRTGKILIATRRMLRWPVEVPICPTRS